MKKIIATDKAPGAVGAYSQAVMAGDLLFTSGQIPLDPATGQMVEGDISLQAKRAMENIGAILAEAGMTFDHVVKTVIYLKNIEDFAAVNQVYESFFSTDFPARSCFAVAALPKGAAVEIEAVAVK